MKPRDRATALTAFGPIGWIRLLADLKDGEDIRNWWFELVQAMGIDEFMFQRMLRSRMDPQNASELAKDVVGLRDEIMTG